jgi:hypothetical protein
MREVSVKRRGVCYVSIRHGFGSGISEVTSGGALCYKPEGHGFDSRGGHWIFVFNWSTPSSRITALGSTQPVTEISMRNLCGGKGRPARKADNLTAICEPIF